MLLEPEEDDEAVEREAEEADQDVVDQHQHPRRGRGDGELDPETRNNLPPLRGHIVGTVTTTHCRDVLVEVVSLQGRRGLQATIFLKTQVRGHRSSTGRERRPTDYGISVRVSVRRLERPTGEYLEVRELQTDDELFTLYLSRAGLGRHSSQIELKIHVLYKRHIGK